MRHAEFGTQPASVEGRRVASVRGQQCRILHRQKVAEAPVGIVGLQQADLFARMKRPGQALKIYADLARKAEAQEIRQKAATRAEGIRRKIAQSKKKKS